VKAAYDRDPASVDATSPLVQLVKTIEFELVQEEIHAREHAADD
jgi:hypothetical protein